LQAALVGRFAGRGIGFAGASQIVRQHGGEMAVESQLGHGSSVTLRLPLSGLDGAVAA
jgi:signal transduction histidine kinase